MPSLGVSSTFPVVCIGGSAGSLIAYREIVRQLPADAEMAIVIVSHRALEGRGLFLKLLAADSRMNVVEVTDGMSLESGCIFVAPPHQEITTDGVTLRLAPDSRPHPGCGWPILISTFMFSLAHRCSSRAIAIVLSGMGHDGRTLWRL